MINVRNKIIEKLKESNPQLDLSIGSNYRDLLINPLSVLLEGYEADLGSIKRLVNGTDLETLNGDEMDAFAANFLITRNQGSKASGKIRFYFAEAQSLNIPSGTVLEKGNLQFETVSDVYISKIQLQNNVDQFGQFYSIEVAIIAREPGASSSLEKGATVTLRGSLSLNPSKIVVSTAFTGGQNEETNIALADRIKTSLYSNSLSSPEVIKARVQEQSDSVLLAEVVGANSPFMVRDLTSKTSSQESVVHNFLYVASGQQDDPYKKGHSCRVDNFAASIVNGSVQWPASPAEWNSEVTDSFYKSISKLADGLTGTYNQYQIVSYDSFQNRLLINEFGLHDGLNRNNSLLWNDEIRVDGTAAVLGKTFSSNDQPPVQVSLDVISGWNQELAESIAQKDFARADQIREQIAKHASPDTYSNTSPVMHKSIDQHTGISIDTQMSTTDGTEHGEIAYVTVLRNSALYAAHDGYGLAWKKQPEWLIRIHNDEYTDADLERFEDAYGVNPVTENLVGNLNQEANKQYWEYNIYLVDNDILQKEVYQGMNQIIDQTGGINQFLQAGKAWVVPNETYDFRVKIWETLATKIWVKPSTAADFSDSSHLVTDRGATNPQYVPNAGSKIVTGDSAVDVLDATRGHFGIGVGETRGWEWSVNSVYVRSFVETFPMQLYRFNFDIDGWGGAGEPAVVNWWGYGYDMAYPNTGRSELAVWNPGSEQWESLGKNLSYPSDSVANKKITKRLGVIGDYLETEGGDTVLYVAASASNSGSEFTGHVDHNLVTHYVEVRNPEADSYHRGNAIDVYCHAPSDITTIGQEYIVDATSGEVVISGSYLQDIIEVRETTSQIVVPGTDYLVFNTHRGESFGPNSKFTLAFTDDWKGASITLITRNWVTGDQINNYLNSDTARYPTTSPQAKVMPPAVLEFGKLQYSGSATIDEMKEQIRDWVYTLDKTFEKSDLINFMYSVGATFVDLDMSITIKQYNTDFSWTVYDFTGQRYVIPNTTISQFYTDVELLSGVISV